MKGGEGTHNRSKGKDNRKRDGRRERGRERDRGGGEEEE